MVATADLEYDWLFRLNEAVSIASLAEQTGDVAFRIKQAFRGQGTWRDPVADASVTPSTGLWTVDASSNGVTAGASDLWLTAADCIPGTGGGVARSWIVLRYTYATGIYHQLLIDLGAAASQRIRFVWATDLNPFNLASPSATASPATPTEGAENSDTTDTTVIHSTLVAHTIHCLRNSAGGVVVVVSRDGTGLPEFVLRHDMLGGGASNDRYPARFGHQRATTGDGGANVSLWNGTAASNAARHAHYVDGTMIDAQTAQLYLASAGVMAGSSAASTGDGISGEWHSVPETIWSNASSTRNGFRGYVPDLGLKVEANVATNTVETSADNDPIRRITMGGFSLLTDGETLWSL